MSGPRIFLPLLCALVLTVSPSSAEQRTIVLDFAEVPWRSVLEVISKFLNAEVSGTPPACRVTIRTSPMPVERVVEQLNRTYGLAFVELEGNYTVYVPDSTDRMCSIDLVSG